MQSATATYHHQLHPYVLFVQTTTYLSMQSAPLAVSANGILNMIYSLLSLSLHNELLSDDEKKKKVIAPAAAQVLTYLSGQFMSWGGPELCLMEI